MNPLPTRRIIYAGNVSALHCTPNPTMSVLSLQQEQGRLHWPWTATMHFTTRFSSLSTMRQAPKLTASSQSKPRNARVIWDSFQLARIMLIFKIMMKIWAAEVSLILRVQMLVVIYLYVRFKFCQCSS